MTQKKPKEPLFIGIASPGNVRRSLLESSKSLLVITKQMEHIKEVRSQKLEQISIMQVKLRELKILLAKLRRKMPDVTVKLPQDPQVAKPIMQKTAAPQPVKVRSELQSVEDEIAAIEAKLKGI